MTAMQLRDYAKVGARIRLQAIETERAAILADFPELRNGQSVKRAGHAMSASQRKAVSRRMRAYWAKRKAEKKGK